MHISVIIPNLHSPFIDRTLDSLRQQTRDLSDVEVIVVGMDKHGLVEEDAVVRHLPTESPVSPAIARNLGMREATGDLFAFTDADCLAAPDWLDVMVRNYADPSVHVVGGGIAFPQDNYWSLSDNLSWFHEVLATAPAGTRPYLPTLNLSMRREVYETVGGLDESFPRPAGEDTEWTTRMRATGYTLHFDPRAVIYHHHTRQSLIKLLEHAFYFGHNSVKVDPRYKDAIGFPSPLRHPLPLLALSPLLAAGATARVFASVRRHLQTAPVVYLTKLSWCVGAARRLQRESS